MERLEGTPIRLQYKVGQMAKEHVRVKLGGKWSIQENIGHLIDLEPIWQGRLDDILGGAEFLRAADLENKKTDAADHNKKDIGQLLRGFARIRQKTLDRLGRLNETEIYKYALHPRLGTPMRTMDLFLFVAEHDDHHLVTIRQIYEQLTTKPKPH